MITFFTKLFFTVAGEKRKREQEEKNRSVDDVMLIDDMEEEARAERVYDALEYAVALEFYQPGYKKWDDGTNKTFCNVLAKKFMMGNFDYGLYDNKKDPVFAWLDYDLQEVFPGEKINTILYGKGCSADYDAAMAAVLKGTIKKLTPYQAQCAANVGHVVWVICKTKGWGHEAIVCPSGDFYCDDTGPMVSQAGGVNFHNKPISHKYCFGKGWKALDIIFVQLNPVKTEIRE